ncbi:hypothetical protein [Paenisporosarcina sp.]|uniref:hypothetical protein n=1 Tax=Paenisporosarcina sp. TaxID=1932001 RepID=UPI003C78A1DB
MTIHKISGQFKQENWDQLTDLKEYFEENSIGKVSINQALKICVNYTYHTLRDYEELEFLRKETSALKKKVEELEEKEIENNKVIKNAILVLSGSTE